MICINPKYNTFISFLQTFISLSTLPFLVTPMINTISTLSDNELIKFITPHAESQYLTLLEQICTMAYIDINKISLDNKKFFCTYIYYFQQQLNQ